MGTWIDLTTEDGQRIAAYRAAPDSSPRGGLVVIQEIFVVNAHIRSIADGFARDGDLAAAKLDRERTLAFCRRHIG